MTVRFHGVAGGRSSPQVKAGSTTTHLGMRAGRVAEVEGQVGLRVADGVAEELVAPLDLAR